MLCITFRLAALAFHKKSRNPILSLLANCCALSRYIYHTTSCVVPFQCVFNVLPKNRLNNALSAEIAKVPKMNRWVRAVPNIRTKTYILQPGAMHCTARLIRKPSRNNISTLRTVIWLHPSVLEVGVRQPVNVKLSVWLRYADARRPRARTRTVFPPLLTHQMVKLGCAVTRMLGAREVN
jgi:hypothetical protein